MKNLTDPGRFPQAGRKRIEDRPKNAIHKVQKSALRRGEGVIGYRFSGESGHKLAGGILSYYVAKGEFQRGNHLIRAKRGPPGSATLEGGQTV